MTSTHPDVARAALPLPLGCAAAKRKGRGEGTLSARDLERTIALNVAEILEE